MELGHLSTGPLGDFPTCWSENNGDSITSPTKQQKIAMAAMGREMEDMWNILWDMLLRYNKLQKGCGGMHKED